MKMIDAINLMEDNISRGIMLEGAGCVTYFVPKRDFERFIKLCEVSVPVNIVWSVGTLKDYRVTMKKGLYEVGRLHDESFKRITSRYFKGKFVKTHIRNY